MLIKEFFRGGIKHGIRLCRDSGYRRYCLLESRYARMPRHRQFSLRTGGWRLTAADAASFLSMWREIFLEEIYRFRSAPPAPVILDLGANIGLSVLFFKKQHPEAKIIAYEADPYLFGLLRENLAGNRAGAAELYNQAVWDGDGILNFRGDHADGGSVVEDSAAGGIEVPAVDIRTILRPFDRIDYLKIDIEGAENRVIPAAGELLKKVENIFVEYHSPRNRPQELAALLAVLESAGFRLKLQSLPAGLPSDPFDMQLNIFGRRAD